MPLTFRHRLILTARRVLDLSAVAVESMELAAIRFGTLVALPGALKPYVRK